MENRIRGKISTSVKGKVHKFLYEYFQYYNIDYKNETYCFDIWEEGREEEFKFSFMLLILNKPADLKVIDMFAMNEYYRGKGIARAIIIEAKKILGKRIISSSNYHKLHNRELRKPDATRVWEKMVEDGLAGYNIDGDYFYTV